MKDILKLILVEDNQKLSAALKKGLEDTGKFTVELVTDNGETCIHFLEKKEIDLVILDVEIKGENGIKTAIAIRKNFPRLPILFYSIQDDDSYFREFRNSGILSHYAFVKKSNYLLPSQLTSIIRDAYLGKSFIDPEIENRVRETKFYDENSPLALLEPRELEVVRLISYGFTNEQIAKSLNIKDKRTVSRINGQIYSLWGLDENSSEEKVARTRASLIYRENKFLYWKENLKIIYLDTKNEEVELKY